MNYCVHEKSKNWHFERKECFSVASCEVLWEFLMEAKTSVFIVERRP